MDELLRQFDTQWGRELHHKFERIVRASELNLWYNPDTDELISSRELDYRRRKRMVRQFSMNPDHPVFGNVESYSKSLGPRLVNYSRSLRELGTALSVSISVKEFARAVADKEPALIWNLGFSHPVLRELYLEPDLWETLIVMEKSKRGLPPRKSIAADLKVVYLGMRRPSLEVTEHVDTQTIGNRDPLKEIAFTIAEEQGLVDGDKIVLIEGFGMRAFGILRTKEGVDIEPWKTKP